ncbi:MAG: hypothetical protein J4473_03590 [Candidatus Aenigmarchaeota archaeon]|nr:hypothetical protein [Candidatus Aenigmarchaeota archaeon]
MVLALTLIVDSNILFASVIKDGVNAKLILSDRLHLIAPEKLFEEFERNRAVLVKRTHRSVEEFEKFLNVLEERIEVIPKSEFKPWLKEAKKKSPANDFPFTALAKAYGCSVWSNDKELKESMKKTGFAEVLNTDEVLQKLGFEVDPTTEKLKPVPLLLY